MSFTYEDRYVAFIDILGFSELVRRSEDDNGLFAAVQEALEMVSEFENREPVKPGIFWRMAHAFSDNIVMSVPANHGELQMALLPMAGALCRWLLGQGFLTRGAIVRGPLHHSGQVVFGGGLIQAASLEKEQAIYPRLLVTQEVRIHGATDIQALAVRYGQVLRQDADKWFHYDYLRCRPAIGLEEKEPVEAFTRIRSIIARNLSTQTDQHRRKKWTWLAGYFNETVRAESALRVSELAPGNEGGLGEGAREVT